MNNVVKEILIILGFIVIAIVNTGCGKGTFEVPEDVKPYVFSFMEEARKRGYDIKEKELVVTFAEDIGHTVIGDCMNGAVPSIRISKPFWDYNTDPMKREVLVYHELGHCWLNKGHVHPPTPSVMNGVRLSASYYELHREALLNDLFQ